MNSVRTISIVGVFTAMIVASDFLLTSFYNVKLLDTLVFACAFAFGFRTGAYVALLSELIWGLVSPNGMAILILPFLLGGELLFALAGLAASRIWGRGKLSFLSVENLYFGALLAICAFIWDIETNIATGLLEGARALVQLVPFLVVGIPFMIPHEVSNFVLGSTLAPLVIIYFSHAMGKRKEVAQSSMQTRRIGTG
jgi:uncharacterized membrane protein